MPHIRFNDTLRPESAVAAPTLTTATAAATTSPAPTARAALAAIAQATSLTCGTALARSATLTESTPLSGASTLPLILILTSVSTLRRLALTLIDSICIRLPTSALLTASGRTLIQRTVPIHSRHIHTSIRMCSLIFRSARDFPHRAADSSAAMTLLAFLS